MLRTNSSTRAVRCANMRVRAYARFSQSAGAKQRSTHDVRSARQAALRESRVRAHVRARVVTRNVLRSRAAVLATREQRRCCERCSRVTASKKMIRIFDALPTMRLGFGLMAAERRPSALASPWASLGQRRLGTWRRASLNTLSQVFCTLKGCKSLVCRLQHP